jgi:hypothetical protein
MRSQVSLLFGVLLDALVRQAALRIKRPSHLVRKRALPHLDLVAQRLAHQICDLVEVLALER